MPKVGMGRLVAEELRRVLEEFDRADAAAEKVNNERKRIASVAHRMVFLLRSLVGARAADRMIVEFGLADSVGKLPGTPGRKPSVPERAPRVEEAPARARVAGRRQAEESSEAGPLLAKDTPVRMRAGLYADWTGRIRWTRVIGSKVIYTVTLAGPGGRVARTQITPRSQGRKWDVVGQTAPARASRAAPQEPARPTVRRRKAAEVPVPSPSLPAGILPKHTAIRMLAGRYLGFTGVVASVHAKDGPNLDALYALALRGPDGRKARTSVKQSSLGRVWVKA